MSNSTIYDVKVKYAVDGAPAVAGLKSIHAAAEKTSEGVFSIKGALEALAIKEIFSIGKEALIDFNSEIDNMKIGMTTVMQMNLHMPFEKARMEADKLFETFQVMAKKSPLMTKDFMEMASAIAPAVAMAGGGPDKLAKLTAGALTAGMAYGSRADITAMDVQEMLMGSVNKKNRLGNQLLGSIGMDHEEFNKKSGSERASLVEKMFTNDGLKKAADRFGETFKGQLSTIEDNLQIALGQAGRPLMESLTAEAKKINMWIEKNPKAIAEFVSDLGGALKDTFGAIKDAAGWLLDNRDLLETLAKTFLVFKGAQMGTNIIKKFAEGAAGLVDNLKGAGSELGNIFGSGEGGILSRVGMFGSLLGKAIPYIGLFTAALEVASGLVNSYAASDKKARDAGKSIHEAVGDYPQLLERSQLLADALHGKGALGPMASGNADLKGRMQTEMEGIQAKLWDPQKLGEALRKVSDAAEEHGGKGFKTLDLGTMQKAGLYLPELYNSKNKQESEQFRYEAGTILGIFNKLGEDTRTAALHAAFPEQYGGQKPVEAPTPDGGWKGGEKPNVNVTIQHIEVASEDPDRFVFGLSKIAEQATKHSTQSQHSISGGL